MVEHSYRTGVRLLVSMETGEDQLAVSLAKRPYWHLTVKEVQKLLRREAS
jgi:hypothetical protein